MNKQIFAVCEFHFIASVLSLLPEFKHEVVVSGVDVINKFVELYDRRNPPKIWAEVWKMFEGEQIELCEQAYGAFTRYETKGKLEFQLCFETDSQSDNSEEVHVRIEDRSFSVDTLCCKAYIPSASKDVYVSKYYLVEAEDECVFVFVKVKDDLKTAVVNNVESTYEKGKEKVDDDDEKENLDEEEKEKLDDEETIIDLRYEICPVDSGETDRDDPEKSLRREAELILVYEKTDNRPKHAHNESKHNFRVGLRKRKAQ